MLMSPKELANKIVAGILRSPGVTYSRLEQHALSLGISIGVFENSMSLVHKNKQIQAKLKGGVLVYIIREEKKPVKIGLTIPYPYTPICNTCKGTLCANCFPFYDKDKDTIEQIRARLIMTREEYKALASGRTFIPRKKKYEYQK